MESKSAGLPGFVGMFTRYATCRIVETGMGEIKERIKKKKAREASKHPN